MIRRIFQIRRTEDKSLLDLQNSSHYSQTLIQWLL